MTKHSSGLVSGSRHLDSKQFCKQSGQMQPARRQHGRHLIAAAHRSRRWSGCNLLGGSFLSRLARRRRCYFDRSLRIPALWSSDLPLAQSIWPGQLHSSRATDDIIHFNRAGGRVAPGGDKAATLASTATWLPKLEPLSKLLRPDAEPLDGSGPAPESSSACLPSRCSGRLYPLGGLSSAGVTAPSHGRAQSVAEARKRKRVVAASEPMAIVWLRAGPGGLLSSQVE